MRSASSFNGQRIRASTFRSIGPVRDSSHRLALVPNELILPSLLQCMNPLWHKADIAIVPNHVRFWGKADIIIGCPLVILAVCQILWGGAGRRWHQQSSA